MVQLPNFSTEQFDDTKDLASQQDRKAERTVQTFALGENCPEKTWLMHGIRDANRSAGRPDLPRQPGAGCKVLARVAA